MSWWDARKLYRYLRSIGYTRDAAKLKIRWYRGAVVA